MTTRQLGQIRKDAYNQAYGYDGTVELPDGLSHFLEVYENKKVVQEFCEQPMQYFTSKPDTAPQVIRRTSKEIALEAAVAIMDRAPTEITFNRDEKAEPWGTRLVRTAETIYQWLTEPVTDKR